MLQVLEMHFVMMKKKKKSRKRVHGEIKLKYTIKAYFY